jgi:hypothetical protein
MFENMFGYLTQLNLNVQTYTNTVTVYAYYKNAYRIRYKSNFYSGVCPTWLDSFYIFYTLWIPREYKLYNYRKGGFTGRILISSIDSCTPPKGERFMFVGVVYKMKTAFLACNFGRYMLYYRQYSIQLITTDEHDTLILTNFTDIFISKHAPLTYVPCVLSDKGALFITSSSSKHVTHSEALYYKKGINVPTGTPVKLKLRKKLTTALLCPDGCDFIFSFRTSSYALQILCLASKSMKDVKYTIRPVSIRPPVESIPRRNIRHTYRFKCDGTRIVRHAKVMRGVLREIRFYKKFPNFVGT